jgi:rhodanese-related sulfurtransferase
MTPAEFLERWPEYGEDPGVVLLDVREPHELDIAAVAGTAHIPMQHVPGRLGELDPSKTIVVMCHGGMRSMQVAAFLKQNGFERVVNLDGGIDAWSVTVDGTLPRY